jgi:hypothetical protein
VTFAIPTTMTVKNTIFSYVTSCISVEVSGQVAGTYCLSFRTEKETQLDSEDGSEKFIRNIFTSVISKH